MKPTFYEQTLMRFKLSADEVEYLNKLDIINMHYDPKFLQGNHQYVQFFRKLCKMGLLYAEYDYTIYVRAVDETGKEHFDLLISKVTVGLTDIGREIILELPD